jgi:hypothetical protein
VLPSRRLSGLLAVGLLAVLPAPGQAANSPGTVSSRTPVVHWKGTFDQPAVLGCRDATNVGCDVTDVTVVAPKGSWITISLDDQYGTLSVTADGRLMGSGGTAIGDLTNPDAKPTPTTTFQHIAAGRVTYQVAAGEQSGSTAGPIPYTGTAKLAGKGFDRAGDCGITPGIEHLSDGADGRTRPIAVRLVADPKDAPTVRQAGRTITEIYARIGVPVVVSYDFRAIPPYRAYPYEGIQAAYGGARPPGIDVVHVMTDDFAGGFADCIGGVAYAEKAFSVGNVHYTVQGTVPVTQVPAGMVAAHEIGHLLGAQHQQYNCGEAIPQQVQQPASDGWVGPCTLMSPTALNASETFSTLERNTIRYFVEKYAGKS